VTAEISHPCAKCGASTRGIMVGELCASCTQTLRRRAGRLARWVALLTTLIVAGYFSMRLRSVAPAWTERARITAAVAIVAWYWLTFRIVQRIALEWLK
jgi:hypothetical protein